jgi:hypothetical protein
MPTKISVNYVIDDHLTHFRSDEADIPEVLQEEEDEELEHLCLEICDIVNYVASYDDNDDDYDY